MRRWPALSVALYLACQVAWTQAGQARDVPVQHRWKPEVFEWGICDALKDYREGDTVVLTGFVAEKALYHYGHRGYLSYPADAGGLKPGTLVRGRFTVKLAGGEKRLFLAELLESAGTEGLLERAQKDYAALLPEIRRVTALKGSKLVLADALPTNRVRFIPPPEGWRTLYVTVRQADRMYFCDVAFRYEFNGKDYTLAECWAFQAFKGE